MVARRFAPLALACAGALVLAGCSSSPTAHGGTTILRAAPADSSHGTADIAAAGSLEGIVQSSLEPAFAKRTGDRLVAKFAGSTDIAHGVLDGELSPGAFLSVGDAAIKLLWPSRARFAMTLATDPLVVAYSPHSRYASQLDEIRSGKEPLGKLFLLMERPGFRLARTDPNDDPQGGFFILMVELAQHQLGLPPGTAARILGTTSSNDIGASGQLVDEDALPTDLATGAFDAGSDYLTEARQYKLDYISLPPSLDFADPADTATYSSRSLRLTGHVVFQGGLITLDDTLVLAPAPEQPAPRDVQADEAWLAFLISPTGRALLAKAGYTLQRPSLALAAGYSTRSVLPKLLLSQYESDQS